MINYPKGPKHWNWKGGTYKNSVGYIYAYAPNHPFRTNQGYVFAHRLKMEKYLKRYLLSWEIINHINHIKTDNRIQNLELTDQQKHSSYHHKGKNNFHYKDGFWICNTKKELNLKHRAYHNQNKERLNARNRELYNQNKEERKRKARERYNKNKEILNQKARKRYHQKKFL